MKKRKWKKSDTIGWLVMLPTLVLFTFFVWEPLLENIRISLYSAKGYELLEFVGLKNYIKVIQAPKFFQVVKNTFSYTLWSLVIGFIVPIIMYSCYYNLFNFLFCNFFNFRNNTFKGTIQNRCLLS